jgi:hypothetical protein
MNEPTAYEIVIRGNAGERLLRPLLDDFTVDHPERQLTRLSGVVRDASHLHGVLAYLTSVTAEVVSVIQANLSTGNPPHTISNTISNERNQT